MSAVSHVFPQKDSAQAVLHGFLPSDIFPEAKAEAAENVAVLKVLHSALRIPAEVLLGSVRDDVSPAIETQFRGKCQRVL